MLKPKSNEEFRKLLNKWVMNFYDNYLADYDQEKLPKIQRRCFQVSYGDARQRLAPDVEG
jgi:hypothetical protein